MMKQEHIFDKIGLILDELQNQYRVLAKDPKSLDELEIEIFQANAKFLSDYVGVIQKLNLSTSVPQKPNLQTPEIAPAIADLPLIEVKAEEIIETDEDLFKPEHEVAAFEFIMNEALIAKTLNEESFEIVQIENDLANTIDEEVFVNDNELDASNNLETIESNEDEIGPEPFLVTKNTDSNVAVVEEIIPEILLPKTKEKLDAEKPEVVLKPTINDLLANNQNLNNLNNKASVGDLKTAINLNDKLLYIKDLFNGYNLAYAEAIDLINKMPNFEAANLFLQKNYAVKNNWETKQTTVDQFYLLLHQRFS